MKRIRIVLIAAAALVIAIAIAHALAACGGEMSARRTDGLDVRTLPESVRADYELFAERCSKCHALSRPLNIGIDNDPLWAIYVERMRRQPGSGISPEDTTAILRFLHYYVEAQRAAKGPKNGSRLAPSFQWKERL